MEQHQKSGLVLFQDMLEKIKCEEA